MFSIKRAKRGFTLIELLVVIAIIAILAAILFPVFARARENARRASCASNLKQIGLGIMQYSQDYDEKYPMTTTMPYASPKPFYGGVDWGMWMVNVHPYVKSAQVYGCPSGRGVSPTTTSDYVGTPSGNLTFPVFGNYGVNEYVIQDSYYQQNRVTPGVDNSGLSLAKVTSPSLLVMIADCAGPVMGQSLWRVINSNNGTATWSSVGGPIDEKYARHLGGSNILYADGHVKFQNQNQMGPDGTRASMASQFQFKAIIHYDDDRLK